MAVSAALVSSSKMKDRVIGLRNATSRTMQLEERESLYNDLTETAQNYSFGWESGSDAGDDDE